MRPPSPGRIRSAATFTRAPWVVSSSSSSSRPGAALVDSPRACALPYPLDAASAQNDPREEEDPVANQVGKRYQCTKCGTEMIVTKGGDGDIGCCGEPMQQKQ